MFSMGSIPSCSPWEAFIQALINIIVTPLYIVIKYDLLLINIIVTTVCIVIKYDLQFFIFLL